MIMLFRGVLIDERVVDRKVPNDAGLRALTLILWENLVLVVVLVLESKAH